MTNTEIRSASPVQIAAMIAVADTAGRAFRAADRALGMAWAGLQEIEQLKTLELLALERKTATSPAEVAILTAEMESIEEAVDRVSAIYCAAVDRVAASYLRMD